MRQYARRNTTPYDVRHLFSPDDPVLLKERQQGKLFTRARGPYQFLYYNGNQNVTATIADPRGRRRRVSVANLLPVRSPMPPALAFRVHEDNEATLLTPEEEEQLVGPADNESIEEGSDEYTGPVTKRACVTFAEEWDSDDDESVQRVRE